MWLPQQYSKDAEEIGLDEKTIQASLSQIEDQLNSSPPIPAILTLRHLSKRCNVNVKTLRSFVNRQDSEAYRTFSIRKRSGGRRFIAIPSPDLMITQRWINNFILKKGDTHSASHAFEKDASILKCAAQHCKAKWLIKLDITDFFSSISEIQVYRVFKEFGYQPLVSFELARLCTISTYPHSPRQYFQNWEVRNRNLAIPDYSQKLLGYLPQGAPTSPLLSNLIAKPLDETLTQLAKKHGLKYTRYSDDLCFSSHDYNFSRQVAKAFLKESYSILNASGYKANLRKTKIIPPGVRKVILGLNVDDVRPKLQKKFKNNIRQHLYYLDKLSPKEHAHNRSFDSVWGLKCHLRGLIDFANMIEPKLSKKWLDEFKEIDWPV